VTSFLIAYLNSFLCEAKEVSVPVIIDWTTQILKVFLLFKLSLASERTTLFMLIILM
jgi:hypothetical protein